MTRKLPLNIHSSEYGGIHPLPFWFLYTPAYTVICFLRAPLGYEMCRPIDAIRHGVVLIFSSELLSALWVSAHARPLPDSVGLRFIWYFTAAHFVISCVIFARRSWGQRHGEQVHTCSAGHFFLTRHTRLPVFLSEVVIMPGGVFVLGYWIYHYASIALGAWLICASISLLLMSAWETARYWSQIRATADDFIWANDYEERTRTHENLSGHDATGNNKKDKEPDFADLN
jgi:hypothetical protein